MLVTGAKHRGPGAFFTPVRLKMAIEIGDVPMEKWVDFPVRYVNVEFTRGYLYGNPKLKVIKQGFRDHPSLTQHIFGIIPLRRT